MPSASSEANASASACAHSISPSSAVAAALELADQLRVDGEAVRHPQQPLVELAQQLARAPPCRAPARRCGRAGTPRCGARPTRSRALRDLRAAAPGGGRVSSSQARCWASSTSAAVTMPAADQLVGPQLADALCSLIVAYMSAACRRARPTRCGRAAVADQIDQRVVAEALAEGEREPRRRRCTPRRRRR